MAATMMKDDMVVLEWPLADTAGITLENIEFDNDFEPQEGRPHRTIFVFRLHMNLDEGVYHDIPVTMNIAYDDLDDLRQKAWTELYILLRQFAEMARKGADVPEISFKTPE